MPRTGTPMANSSGSAAGAPGSYTDAGPPDRIRAAGLRAASSSTEVSNGAISEYTCASRTRRAMSCAYCAPKSTTRTGLGSAPIRRRAPFRSAHADVLGLLLLLPLGLDGGRHDQLGLLELPARTVARGGHGCPQGTEQVQRAVVVMGRP